MHAPRCAAVVVTVLLLAAAAAADTISGQVVDANGQPVPGVNIDAFDVFTGQAVGLLNDGTNANGLFTTTIPPGLFRIQFKPPRPPTTTHVALELANVVVVGATDLGVVVLPAGISLHGRLVDVNGVPVEAVNLDVRILSTGADVLLQADRTGRDGLFNIAVPASTPLELLCKTNAVTSTMAPRALTLTLTADTDLGDLTLQPGFFLTGSVERSGGLPVAGAKLDVFDSVSRVNLFTPTNRTNANGVFSVVIPAATYSLEICASAASLLVAQEVFGVAVASDTDVGTLTMQEGVRLSGTITDFTGAPAQNADVDVRSATTGLAVLLCGDNSNAAGAYSVIVPTGTFHVLFTPAGGCASGLGQDDNRGVLISGDTVLDGVLPDATATVAVFDGDGVNVDMVSPVAARLGAPWSVPLTIGHAHGTSGAVLLEVRTGTLNGPRFPSPFGGRPMEFLTTGPVLGRIPGTHDGVSGGIVPRLIPNNPALLGRAWSAQYIVVGGGFVDLSRAVFGVIGCP